MNIADLRKPFPPERISWRVGSTTQDKSKGMALAYIDARDVMSRLDEVCGLHWQAEYVPMPNGSCCCRVGIKVGEEWIWRSNGALNITDSDKVDAKEMAEKGSYSDAFKRAAVLFGIGQYLYDLDSPWVALDDKKRIVQSEYPKLRALLPKPNGNGATKPPPDEDVAAGARNWVDKQKDTIIAFNDMDALDNWLKKNAALNGREGNWDRPTPGSALDKLLKFSAPLFNELKTYYMEKMREV